MADNIKSKKRILVVKIISRSFIIWIFLFHFGCSHNEQSENNGKPKIQFSHIEFDFGNITMGEIVSHRFPFKSIGTGDLKIENVISSCGCAVVDYDKSPVQKDKESFIEVSFNSDGYRGLQMKQIEVYSNCDSSKTVLTLWAKVIEDVN